MINKEAINSILRAVLSGKEAPGVSPTLQQEEVPGQEEGTAPVIAPTPAPRPTDSAITEIRYYFYTADDEKHGIKFNDLLSVLKDESTRQKTVDNLRGGPDSSGDKWPDYFSWKKVIVKQSSSTGNVVIYEADLNKDGTLNGAAKLTPSEGTGTPDDFASKNDLFSVKGNKKIITLDTTNGVSVYSSENPEGLALRLKTERIEGPQYKNYETFKAEIFPRFRLLDTSKNILVLPDYQPAKASSNAGDMAWAYGAYPGGESAFKTYIAKYDKGTSQETPQGMAAPESPVSETPQQPKKGPVVKPSDVIQKPGEAPQPTIPTIPKQAVWQVIRGYTDKMALGVGTGVVKTNPAQQGQGTPSQGTGTAQATKKRLDALRAEQDATKKLYDTQVANERNP